MKYDGNEIKVVWVDLDDTLIDFRSNSRRALAGLYNKEGLDRYWPTAEAWADCYEKYNLQLWAEYNLDRISRDFLMMERFRRPLVEAGLSDSEAREASPRLSDEYFDLLAAEKQTEPGAFDLLKLLRGEGVRIGILSNGFCEVQYRKIRSAGLDKYVDLVVLSDDIGVNKPDVRLYRYAQSRSGVAEPEAHLMIGDNPDTDIEGALRAGWKAIGYFKNQADPVVRHPEFVSVNALSLAGDMIDLDAALPKG